MPRQAPRFRPPGWRPPMPWATSQGRSAAERGYGAEHRAIRKQVLIEEPLCRLCIAEGITPPRPTAVADHIVNQAEGGQTVRSNYQGLCWPHSKAKTARESGRARRRSR